jgi:hypothetical protein
VRLSNETPIKRRNEGSYFKGDAPNGPWRSSPAATGGPRFLNVHAGNSMAFSAQVPMIYRIALITNAPPHGHNHVCTLRHIVLFSRSVMHQMRGLPTSAAHSG